MTPKQRDILGFQTYLAYMKALHEATGEYFVAARKRGEGDDAKMVGQRVKTKPWSEEQTRQLEEAWASVIPVRNLQTGEESGEESFVPERQKEVWRKTGEGIVAAMERMQAQRGQDVAAE